MNQSTAQTHTKQALKHVCAQIEAIRSEVGFTGQLGLSPEVLRQAKFDKQQQVILIATSCSWQAKTEVQDHAFIYLFIYHALYRRFLAFDLRL